MARQIGKMLNCREPKIISGPGKNIQPIDFFWPLNLFLFANSLIILTQMYCIFCFFVYFLFFKKLAVALRTLIYTVMYMVKQYQFLKADKDRIDQCCVVYIVDIGVSTIQQKSR